MHGNDKIIKTFCTFAKKHKLLQAGHLKSVHFKSVFWAYEHWDCQWSYKITCFVKGLVGKIKLVIHQGVSVHFWEYQSVWLLNMGVYSITQAKKTCCVKHDYLLDYSLFPGYRVCGMSVLIHHSFLFLSSNVNLVWRCTRSQSAGVA